MQRERVLLADRIGFTEHLWTEQRWVATLFMVSMNDNRSVGSRIIRDFYRIFVRVGRRRTYRVFFRFASDLGVMEGRLAALLIISGQEAIATL
jgi:hypothetical protein